jgi:FkbM family methyltransferase
MPALDLVFAALAERPELHAHSSALYQLCKATARPAVEQLFSAAERSAQAFGPFGSLSMPYTKMGAIDSLDLFGLDEMIIFAFYNANRARYRRVLDIGANLGLHSIVMARCGFSVKAFEPDPWHYGLLSDNLAANGASTVTAFKEAVSISDGEAKFVRVLGNTTGSHLAGSKNSYGEKEVFTVPTRAVQPLFKWADLAKIDAEGHEKDLLLETTSEIMQELDIMVEIGNPENARVVFGHFKSIGIGMYAQKMGWGRVQRVTDVPTSHREGSLFISAKPAMPW